MLQAGLPCLVKVYIYSSLPPPKKILHIEGVKICIGGDPRHSYCAFLALVVTVILKTPREGGRHPNMFIQDPLDMN